MAVETLRDEDLRLMELLKRMREELEQPIPHLEALRSDLGKALELLQVRNEALLRARGASLQADPLTGLLNRGAFEEALAQVHQSGEVFSLVWVELDSLPGVAQRLGPQVAEEALRRVGQLVRRALRASDAAARVGEGELALILRGISGDRAFGVCERLRVAVLKYPWQTLHPDLRLTLSLGFASREDEPSSEAVAERARRFLAEAVASGGNQTFPGFYY
ncbi:MAG: GGDEF domain-containing protein [Deinococcus-Thermus bacterium]|jgi:diguanylate cyclase (GGDEF)-like protein|nr:MAG: GGDEF domain-containing protein [Deinococcota bacterium]